MSDPDPRDPERTPPGGWRSWLRRLLLAILALTVVLGLAVVIAWRFFYKMPEWEGAVDIEPLERAERKRCGGDGSPTAAGGRALLRHPYVQDASATEITVMWAAWPQPDIEVAYWPAGDDESRAPRAAPDRRLPPLGGELPSRGARTRGRPVEPDSAQFPIFETRLRNLKPDTLYCYRLVAGDAEEITAPAPFATAPAADSADIVRFLAIGDSGSGRAAQHAIAQRLDEQHFSFLLFLGDIAYTSGTPEQLQDKFFEVYSQYLRSVPAFATIGNHGYETLNGAPFFRSLALPGNERYYARRWGPLLLIGLDSNRFGVEQARWLDRTLEDSDAPWNLVFAHHPMFTGSVRGPAEEFRERFLPILRRHRVRLVLAGHEHHYERLGPIHGIHFVVSGGGGGRLTRLIGTDETRAKRSVHHLLHFEVSPARLSMQAIDIDGEVFDELILDQDLTDVAGAGNALDVEERESRRP